ncbi:MAG: hypothetical protein IK079_00770 [Desulfovibrio sp.]|nr:hypothetical protein [Desulfovibrio sp.]
MNSQPLSQNSSYWRRGCLLALLTFLFALGMRLLELPSWQDPEFRLGSEWLLATHDAYHWVAGAEDFGLAKDHPMATMLKIMANILQTNLSNVAFWFPMFLASFVAVIVFVWVWALGSMEAGIAAGLLASLSPGFLARTLLGFYDTDLVTLFFPLLMTLVPATWAMRYMLLPKTILKRLIHTSGQHLGSKLFLLNKLNAYGNPLRPSWLVFLGLSGSISWWTQFWHSVFPYLLRYNVVLLLCMALFMAPKNKRSLLLLGAFAYIFPALIGPLGCIATICLLFCTSKRGYPLLLLLTKPLFLLILLATIAILLISGDIWQTILNHANSYLKHSSELKTSAQGIDLVYPAVAQSIVEVQDLNLQTLLSYFHPWPEAAFLGLIGFVLVTLKRPAALFLLPLAALALLSTKLGGRMVMFGAPIIAIGLSLPLYWFLRRCMRKLSTNKVGVFTSLILICILILPFLNLIGAMSQGPMINRRHADCLAHVKAMTPQDAMLWLWWDWGYAAHHFSGRNTIADGAQHAGPSLYLPAAVFATDNPRFARQLMRYTEIKGNVAGNVFVNLDGQKAQELMEHLRSTETPLLESRGRIFIITSFEMLRLGFWINNFGNWNFSQQRGEGGALSIIPQELFYNINTGEVRLENSSTTIDAASISIFEETGITHRDYIQEWFSTHPNASKVEQQAFLKTRRNVHFLFNKVTGEKIAVDEQIYQSLMVKLLLGDSRDPLLSPYFKLLYDNGFARIYEVL